MGLVPRASELCVRVVESIPATRPGLGTEPVSAKTVGITVSGQGMGPGCSTDGQKRVVELVAQDMVTGSDPDLFLVLVIFLITG